MDENEKQLNGKDIKILRTYTSDMVDAIRTNEVSVIKIALAEKEKREQENIYKEAEGTNLSKTFLVIGGIILIATAIIGSYFLFLKKKEIENSKPIVITNLETFLSYDSKSYIDVTNITNANELLAIIDKERKVDTGLIKALFLTKTVNSLPEIITSKDFLSIIKTIAPGALTRSLSDKYLIGEYTNKNVVNENDKNATFLIFQTNDYNQAYASMLEWEKTMFKDLFVLFNINTYGTDNSIFEKPWKDILLNNKDARVLYGENGEGILYYVFVDKNTLVITSNKEALKEIVIRLIIKNSRPE